MLPASIGARYRPQPPSKTSERRFDQRDSHGCALVQRAVGLERHQVAGLELLELGNNATSTVHVRRELVLKEVIAVEPAATLTKLHHPGPDLLDRRVDRERGGRDDGRRWGQPVARQRLADLLFSRAPERVIGAHKERIDQYDGREQRDYACE